MTYPDFPLEIVIRASDDVRRGRLVRAAMRHEVEAGDVTCFLVSEGLRVLGRSEQALQRAVEALRRVEPDAPLQGPSVRCVEGAGRLEPHMRVVVHAPAATLPVIRGDLERRGAWILRLDHRIGVVDIEAEAPLARLLGYGDWLAACTQGRARMRMALSRYRLADDRAPDAARAAAHGDGARGADGRANDARRADTRVDGAARTAASADGATLAVPGS
jgi:hypothetical protein